MKLVSLISGGIDSPVASYLMAKAGADVILLHMDNGKYSDVSEIEKIKKIAERLSEITEKEFPLYSISHEKNQTELIEKCEKSYHCVLCKRMMQHVAKEFAKKNGCAGIIMGDSLGQVASQTLANIHAENKGLDFPVVRPLIGMDKQEIMDIARRIGTYDISVSKSSVCGALPPKTITEAVPEKITEEESKIDVPSMISESMNTAKRIQ